MAISIYQLKPQFQALLRPAVNGLAQRGVTANQVTLSACVLSVLLGLCLYSWQLPACWFALIPVWMLLRMALNAVDGMLAREHGQQSVLGAYLNELTDVLSDAALYLPFARVAPFDPFWIGALVLLSAMSEMAGALGGTVGAERRYDGPMGKSDRAAAFGLLGAVVAVWGGPAGLSSAWQPLAWALPVMAALTAWSIFNRIQSGIQQAHERSSG
jgi:CDP-diacylglycerol---glycerol-3-phosphate 3-phosphatidyltransferase